MAKAAQTSPRAAAAKKQLARYRSMRDFKVTTEPSGEESAGERGKSGGSLPFVIQKHAATRLHYDFRLGWNGVLKSWAVTKGPSYFPKDKRLAVQVEDHPIEYGGFEGIIPKGQYGGGTVMLWDRGTWEPHVDVDQGLESGSLKFALHGEKMKGNWALVRMGGRAANESKPNWLLIKEHDSEERGAGDSPITESAPMSVLSGRDMEGIAKDRDKVWQSNRSRAAEASSRSQSAVTTPTYKKIEKPHKGDSRVAKAMDAAPAETMPAFISPQLATLAKSPPPGDSWIHEIKLDGYRIQMRVDKSKKPGIELLTRTGLDWTHRMKQVADAALGLPVKSALIDGEVVVLSQDGNTSFADLQASFQDGAHHDLIYFAFDLLHLNGRNLRELPLLERKRILASIVSNDSSVIRLSEHIAGDAQEIFAHACKLGSEGIVSKLSSAKYAPDRGRSWVKSKCYQEQELVIGGFTLPLNGTSGFGALLLGYYRDGALLYAGRTGTGFTQKIHRNLRERLEQLRRTSSPFSKLPAGSNRGVQWVNPKLVAQISFSNWTADNVVRQASFKGLREDKPAKSVVREVPDSISRRTASSDSAPLDEQDSTKSKGSTEQAPQSALTIRLTHPDKVLDNSTGVTKADLARYYQAVASHMLPYLADRPLTLVRCLDGTEKPCFYQKHKNKMISGNFGAVIVVDKKSGKPEPYITLSTAEVIVELAQIGVLEVHPWSARNESLEKPDLIIFDLDPDESIGWGTIASSALEIRKRLKSIGLKSFVKSTGGKGLHVVIPILPEHEWPIVKQFAHSFVLKMERDAPSLFLTKMTKAARKGKIYLDYLRNERGATAVAPFSPRARAGMPVAMPLSWSELKSKQLPRFFVSELAQWQGRLSRNPWKSMLGMEQHLPLQGSGK